MYLFIKHQIKWKNILRFIFAKATDRWRKADVNHFFVLEIVKINSNNEESNIWCWRKLTQQSSYMDSFLYRLWLSHFRWHASIKERNVCHLYSAIFHTNYIWAVLKKIETISLQVKALSFRFGKWLIKGHLVNADDSQNYNSDRYLGLK